MLWNTGKKAVHTTSLSIRVPLCVPSVSSFRTAPLHKDALPTQTQSSHVLLHSSPLSTHTLPGIFLCEAEATPHVPLTVPTHLSLPLLFVFSFVSVISCWYDKLQFRWDNGKDFINGFVQSKSQNTIAYNFSTLPACQTRDITRATFWNYCNYCSFKTFQNNRGLAKVPRKS